MRAKMFWAGMAAVGIFAAVPARALDLGGFYAAMGVKEERVTFATAEGAALVGVSTLQKSEGLVFCRKQGAVVLRPVYHYSCFLELPDADSALLARDLPGDPVHVILRGADAEVITEKSGPGLICQAAQAGDRFRCFARIQE